MHVPQASRPQNKHTYLPWRFPWPWYPAFLGDFGGMVIGDINGANILFWTLGRGVEDMTITGSFSSSAIGDQGTLSSVHLRAELPVPTAGYAGWPHIFPSRPIRWGSGIHPYLSRWRSLNKVYYRSGHGWGFSRWSCSWWFDLSYLCQKNLIISD